MKKLLLSCLLLFTSTLTVMAISVTISGATTICNGSCGTLTASANGGTPTYTYEWSTTETTASITPCPTSNTTYTVIVTDGSAATASATASIMVNPIPAPSITGTTIICSGNSTTLTANGGGTYSWSTTATGTAITVSPVSNTTYTVTASVLGCTEIATVSITVIPTPTPTITGTTTICSGNSTTLTASGGGTYSWSTGETTTAITVSPTNTTTYTVTATNTGCTGTASTTVIVGAALVPVITGDTIICNGGSTTLTTAGGTYVWSTGETTADITVNPNTPTTYYVTVTSGSCSGTASQTVTVKPLPTPTITGTTTICSGNSTTLTASGGGTYSWSTGETTTAITVSPTNTTTYTVTATNAGCTGIATVVVNIPYSPTAVATGTTVCEGETINLTSIGGGMYSWDGPNAFSSILQNPTITNPTVANSGTYTVTVSNGSCSNTATAAVTVGATPDISIASPSQLTCSNTSATLTASSNTIGVTYQWTNGPATATYTVGTADTYTLTVTDPTNGCNASDTVTVTTQLPSAPICMVTTDSLSQNNIIVWDKTSLIGVDSFIVYREITTNNYQPIGAVPYDSLSQFIDTVRTQYFPNTGDPNTGSYRYKLKAHGTCGSYGPMSPYHNTIYITNVNGIFSWPQLYTIENGSNPVLSYNLMRDDLSTGVWHQVNSVSGTQQTVSDPQYATYQNTASWRLETQFGFNCIPTRSANISISNTYKKGVTAIEKINNNSTVLVKIYPNPFDDNTTFTIQSDKHNATYSFELYDVLGKQVKSINEISTKQFQISRNGLPTGIYFYKIYTAEYLIGIGKVVIE